MKTTIEISDAVLAEARQLAAQHGTTVRALVERGLRRELAERKSRAAPFELRAASFKGKGLQPGAKGQSWEQLRELAYGDRGA
ncbi:MAG: type II toxin-antitoxin system VapB family antitoxin [Rubrivivax sp.]|nr:type II toxin-antitoxin system VapB family antitoxin [Rubrivivax sp.]